MSKLVIIAGPQAAGKSTLIQKLGTQPHTVAPLFAATKPLLFPLQESRQIISHQYMLLGAISMTAEHEQEVVKCDLNRMDLIIQKCTDPHLIYLDECNIFTIAHAIAHGVLEVKKYWSDYISRLQQLQASVIFLNTPPEVSWERLRSQYEKRLVYFPCEQHEEILERYRQYLFDLHPHLLKVYERLPFPKAMIDATLPTERVMETVCQHLASMITNTTP